MAVSPPGDIVLDVARAADPATVEAARTRLEKMAAGSAATRPAFDMAGSATAMGRADIRAASGPVPEEFVKFEAVVLQTFVQSMLPKDTESVFGKGMSGEMWKSMLAEQLSMAVAKQGGVGLASRVLGDHYVDGEKKVPVRGVSAGPEKAAQDARDLMSSALVHEIQRKAAQSIDGGDPTPATGKSRT